LIESINNNHRIDSIKEILDNSRSKYSRAKLPKIIPLSLISYLMIDSKRHYISLETNHSGITVENSENFVIFNKPTQKYKKILIL
jgi:hypothetical protein